MISPICPCSINTIHSTSVILTHPDILTSRDLDIQTSRHLPLTYLHIWMCAYHHLIYHTISLLTAPLCPLPLPLTLSHAATLLLSTRLVPYLRSILLSVSISSLFIFRDACFLLSYFSFFSVFLLYFFRTSL